MRIGTKEFNPERLKEIRWARRIPTMTALARLLSISSSTVSRWEDGISTPDSETLAEMANKLGVRQEFFLRPACVPNRPMFLRSLSTTRNRDLDYQRSQMRWLQEISHVVQHYVDFPTVDIPDVLGGANYTQLRDADFEAIALGLRKHWGIGDGPCTDVVALMERVGFVVGSIEMGTPKLDGLCSWSPHDNRPHVLLATDKMSFFRRQFDAAHELAHGVLHRDIPEDEFGKNLNLIESQANRLASAFLLPSTSYSAEIRVPSLTSLLPLKERWHVSIKAQIRRLGDLEIIPRETEAYLYKMHSAKGWSKGEPLDDKWPLSEPRVLRDAISLIVQERVRSKADLLGLEFTILQGDIENLVGLPNGWFNEAEAEIVKLKTDDNLLKKFLSRDSEVIQFPHKPKS